MTNPRDTSEHMTSGDCGTNVTCCDVSLPLLEHRVVNNSFQKTCCISHCVLPVRLPSPHALASHAPPLLCSVLFLPVLFVALTTTTLPHRPFTASVQSPAR